MSTYSEALKVKEMPEKWLLVFLIVGCTSLIFVVCFPIDFCLYRRRKRQARERKKEAMFKSQMVAGRAGQYHANVSTSQIVDYFILDTNRKSDEQMEQRKPNSFARLVNLFRKKRQEEMFLQMQQRLQDTNADNNSDMNLENSTVVMSTETPECNIYPIEEQLTDTTNLDVTKADITEEDLNLTNGTNGQNSEYITATLTQNISESALVYGENDDLVAHEGKYISYGAIGVSSEVPDDMGQSEAELTHEDSIGDHLEERRVIMFSIDGSGVDETSTDTLDERQETESTAYINRAVSEMGNSGDDLTDDQFEVSNVNVINVLAEVSDVQTRHPPDGDSGDITKPASNMETSVTVDIAGFQRKEKASFKQFLQRASGPDQQFLTGQNGSPFHCDTREQTNVTPRAISENCLTIGVNQPKVATMKATSLNTLPHFKNHKTPDRKSKPRRTGSTLSVPEGVASSNGKWRKKKKNPRFLKKDISMPELRNEKEDIDSDDLVSHEVWTTPETHE